VLPDHPRDEEGRRHKPPVHWLWRVSSGLAPPFRDHGLVVRWLAGETKPGEEQ
jgi:hypothetical protein